MSYTSQTFARHLGVTLLLAALAGCNTPEPVVPPESPPDSGLPADDDILQAVYDQAGSLNLCDGFYQPEVATAESRVLAKSDRALVEIVCARAAYQLVYAYGTYLPDGTVQPLTLDGFYPDQSEQFVRTS
ncbi:MAG: hypothetical protein AAFW95_12455, partial [Cyanobacteria bacterium J06638_6]